MNYQCSGLCVAVAAVAIGAPCSAYPSNLSIDCNSPVDQFTEETRDITAPLTINGSLSVIRLQSNEYSPSFSLMISGSQDDSSTGIMISALDDDAKSLEVELINRVGESITEKSVGHVSASGSIPLSLSLDLKGRVTFQVGLLALQAEQLSVKKAVMVTGCTSGHFSFSGSALKTQ